MEIIFTKKTITAHAITLNNVHVLHTELHIDQG